MLEVGGINHFSDLNKYQVDGDFVNMKVTDKRHIEPVRPHTHNLEDNVGSDFTKMLKGALETVNHQQATSHELNRKLVHNPKSVDIHTVMIAAEQARISLTLTKTVVDQTVRAYRELINMR